MIIQQTHMIIHTATCEALSTGSNACKEQQDVFRGSYEGGTKTPSLFSGFRTTQVTGKVLLYGGKWK